MSAKRWWVVDTPYGRLLHFKKTNTLPRRNGAWGIRADGVNVGRNCEELNEVEGRPVSSLALRMTSFVDKRELARRVIAPTFILPLRTGGGAVAMSGQFRCYQMASRISWTKRGWPVTLWRPWVSTPYSALRRVWSWPALSSQTITFLNFLNLSPRFLGRGFK